MKVKRSCLLLLTALGCSDPPVVPSSTTLSTAGAPTGSGTAGAAASSASELLTPPPKVDVQETEFMESERSRDPFRSFAKSFGQETKAKVRSERKVILSQYSLDELKLIGIVTRAEPAKAMLVDPTGKGFVVQRGQFVGRADVVQGPGASGAVYEINWRVDRIRTGDVVLVREDPANPDVPIATRVIPLRPEEIVTDGEPSTKK